MDSKVEKLTQANNRLTKEKASVTTDNDKLRQTVSRLKYQLAEAKGTIAVWKTHTDVVVDCDDDEANEEEDSRATIDSLKQHLAGELQFVLLAVV